MLLAIDIGNTQTVIGLFDDSDRLSHHWRISTNRRETADEKAIMTTNLLAIDGVKLADVSGVVISSVVPSCTSSFTEAAKRLFKVVPFVVDSASVTDLKIAYKHPHEIGADRIVNALAGFRLFGGPLIIVDFGTATTFDVIAKDGVYLGGAISPGVEISAESLFAAAAKLTRVELAAPKKVVGTVTATSMQSGIVFGAAAMVDGMVERIKKETGLQFKVIATGGLAELIAPHCASVVRVEPFLTLLGLQIIYIERVKSKG